MSLACGAFCFIKKQACSAFFHNFLLKPRCTWFEVSYSVYQFICGENDANSDTEWSQRYNLYQTVTMNVSNNKPFVLRYKSHNTISIPKWFIRNNVQQGNASLYAYRFWRLETARSVQATSLSCPTWPFVYSRARWRLRAKNSRRITRSSGWYHPRCYRLQQFRTATSECACTPNAKSYTRWLLWILTEPV